MVTVIFGVITFLFFYSMFLALGFSAYKPKPTWRKKAHIKYFVLIPCLNEAAVIQKTIESFPRYDGVEIILVDDDSDDGTREIARSLGVRVIHRQLPNARKGKGQSLNYAVNIIRKELQLFPHSRVVIGVFDGDGNPSPGMFHEVHALFRDPTVAAVQSGVRIRNTKTSLGASQDVEFGGLVSLLQGLRTEKDGAILGGNGQFIRLSVLDEMGQNPWTDSLTEDLDIGVRILMKGHKVKYSRLIYVSQQAVEDFPRYIKQRTRWSQGNFQSLKYMWPLFRARMNPFVKAELIYTLLQPIFALMTPLLFIIVATKIGIVSFILLSFLTAIFMCFFHKKYSPSTIWTFAALSYVYYYINYRAFWFYIKGKNTWAKTDRIAEV